MNQENTRFLTALLHEIANTHHVRPGEVPNIDLYMDQVIHFMNEHLEHTRRQDKDKLLTKTMINNYTKKKLLPHPSKKRYSGEHLHLLIFIYYFKDFLSLTDIRTILTPVADRFFKPDEEEGSLTIEDIYAEAYELNEDWIKDTCQDIMRSWHRAAHSFASPSFDQLPAEDQELLQLFSFLCMLGFDIYLKKQVVEKMLDRLFVPLCTDADS